MNETQFVALLTEDTWLWEASEASSEAAKHNLKHVGGGAWADTKGDVVAKTDRKTKKLVWIDKIPGANSDASTNPQSDDPATSPATPETISADTAANALDKLTNLIVKGVLDSSDDTGELRKLLKITIVDSILKGSAQVNSFDYASILSSDEQGSVMDIIDAYILNDKNKLANQIKAYYAAQGVAKAEPKKKAPFVPKNTQGSGEWSDKSALYILGIAANIQDPAVLKALDKAKNAKTQNDLNYIGAKLIKSGIITKDSWKAFRKWHRGVFGVLPASKPTDEVPPEEPTQVQDEPEFIDDEPLGLANEKLYATIQGIFSPAGIDIDLEYYTKSQMEAIADALDPVVMAKTVEDLDNAIVEVPFLNIKEKEALSNHLQSIWTHEPSPKYKSILDIPPESSNTPENVIHHQDFITVNYWFSAAGAPDVAASLVYDEIDGVSQDILAAVQATTFGDRSASVDALVSNGYLSPKQGAALFQKLDNFYPIGDSSTNKSLESPMMNADLHPVWKTPPEQTAILQAIDDYDNGGEGFTGLVSSVPEKYLPTVIDAIFSTIDSGSLSVADELFQDLYATSLAGSTIAGLEHATIAVMQKLQNGEDLNPSPEPELDPEEESTIHDFNNFSPEIKKAAVGLYKGVLSTINQPFQTAIDAHMMTVVVGVAKAIGETGFTYATPDAFLDQLAPALDDALGMSVVGDLSKKLADAANKMGQSFKQDSPSVEPTQSLVSPEAKEIVSKTINKLKNQNTKFVTNDGMWISPNEWNTKLPWDIIENVVDAWINKTKQGINQASIFSQLINLKDEGILPDWNGVAGALSDSIENDLAHMDFTSSTNQSDERIPSSIAHIKNFATFSNADKLTDQQWKSIADVIKQVNASTWKSKSNKYDALFDAFIYLKQNGVLPSWGGIATHLAQHITDMEEQAPDSYKLKTPKNMLADPEMAKLTNAITPVSQGAPDFLTPNQWNAVQQATQQWINSGKNPNDDSLFGIFLDLKKQGILPAKPSIAADLQNFVINALGITGSTNISNFYHSFPSQFIPQASPDDATGSPEDVSQPTVDNSAAIEQYDVPTSQQKAVVTLLSKFKGDKDAILKWMLKKYNDPKNNDNSKLIFQNMAMAMVKNHDVAIGDVPQELLPAALQSSVPAANPQQAKLDTPPEVIEPIDAPPTAPEEEPMDVQQDVTPQDAFAVAANALASVGVNVGDLNDAQKTVLTGAVEKAMQSNTDFGVMYALQQLKGQNIASDEQIAALGSDIVHGMELNGTLLPSDETTFKNYLSPTSFVNKFLSADPSFAASLTPEQRQHIEVVAAAGLSMTDDPNFVKGSTTPGEMSGYQKAKALYQKELVDKVPGFDAAKFENWRKGLMQYHDENKQLQQFITAKIAEKKEQKEEQEKITKALAALGTGKDVNVIKSIVAGAGIPADKINGAMLAVQQALQAPTSQQMLDALNDFMSTQDDYAGSSGGFKGTIPQAAAKPLKSLVAATYFDQHITQPATPYQEPKVSEGPVLRAAHVFDNWTKKFGRTRGHMPSGERSALESAVETALAEPDQKKVNAILNSLFLTTTSLTDKEVHQLRQLVHHEREHPASLDSSFTPIVPKVYTAPQSTSGALGNTSTLPKKDISQDKRYLEKSKYYKLPDAKKQELHDVIFTMLADHVTPSNRPAKVNLYQQVLIKQGLDAGTARKVALWATGESLATSELSTKAKTINKAHTTAAASQVSMQNGLPTINNQNDAKAFIASLDPSKDYNAAVRTEFVPGEEIRISNNPKLSREENDEQSQFSADIHTQATWMQANRSKADITRLKKAMGSWVGSAQWHKNSAHRKAMNEIMTRSVEGPPPMYAKIKNFVERGVSMSADSFKEYIKAFRIGEPTYIGPSGFTTKTTTAQSFGNTFSYAQPDMVKVFLRILPNKQGLIKGVRNMTGAHSHEQEVVVGTNRQTRCTNVIKHVAPQGNGQFHAIYEIELEFDESITEGAMLHESTGFNARLWNGLSKETIRALIKYNNTSVKGIPND